MFQIHIWNVFLFNFDKKLVRWTFIFVSNNRQMVSRPYRCLRCHTISSTFSAVKIEQRRLNVHSYMIWLLTSNKLITQQISPPEKKQTFQTIYKACLNQNRCTSLLLIPPAYFVAKRLISFVHSKFGCSYISRRWLFVIDIFYF